MDDDVRRPDSGWSRRAFLAATGAASAAMFAGQPAVAAEPKRGGMLRLGLGGGGGADSLDTMFSTGSFPQVKDFVLYSYLTEIDRERNVVPSLAESWELSSSGLEWVFKLRPDVTFSNGKSVVAEDVVYSLNRHRGEGSKSSGATLLRPVKDIKAAGKYEVVFTSDSIFLDLPSSLASNRFGIFPAGFEDFAKPIGCGPYVLDSFEPGVRLTASRNPNYFRNDRAWFERVELSLINDSTARLNALLTGRVDAINRIETRTAELLKKSNAVDLVQSSGGQHYVFYMDCNVPEFADPNVRLAMKHALDRDAILQNAISGFGSIGNDHPVGKTDPDFNPNLEQHIFDPDKVKFYLGKAGNPTLKFPLSVSDGAWSGAVEAGISFSQTAGKVGIKIDVVREPASGYMTNVYKKRPFFASYWQGEPSATQIFTRGYQSSSSGNAGNWKSPEMDAMLEAVRTERDDAKRRQIVWEMQALVHRDCSVIVPVFADFLDAKSKKLKGFEPSTYREMDGYRIAERAWLG